MDQNSLRQSKGLSLRKVTPKTMQTELKDLLQLSVNRVYLPCSWKQKAFTHIQKKSVHAYVWQLGKREEPIILIAM